MHLVLAAALTTGVSYYKLKTSDRRVFYSVILGVSVSLFLSIIQLVLDLILGVFL